MKSDLASASTSLFSEKGMQPGLEVEPSSFLNLAVGRNRVCTNTSSGRLSACLCIHLGAGQLLTMEALYQAALEAVALAEPPGTRCSAVCDPQAARSLVLLRFIPGSSRQVLWSGLSLEAMWQQLEECQPVSGITALPQPLKQMLWVGLLQGKQHLKFLLPSASRSMPQRHVISRDQSSNCELMPLSCLCSSETSAIDPVSHHVRPTCSMIKAA